MYWKEIPVQVQAEDGDGQVSLPLDARFQEAADAIAMLDGSAGSDEYLDAWEWGAFEEAPGTAAEVAEARASLYNERIPGDFVARIRDMHRDGSRDPRPGAIDAWVDEQQ